jgi:hypothetical protein
MAGLRGAHEVVVADGEPLPHVARTDARCRPPRLRRYAGGVGALQHLQTVLVHADEEVNVARPAAVDTAPWRRCRSSRWRDPCAARRSRSRWPPSCSSSRIRSRAVSAAVAAIASSPPGPWRPRGTADGQRRAVRATCGPASATSFFSSSSGTVRRLPSSSRRNTRSRQMSVPTTFSRPRRCDEGACPRAGSACEPGRRHRART